MTEPLRINAAETRQHVQAGKALLVCAYADGAAFARYHLDGAISLADFQARAGSLPREQEIIFYCD
jgi:hypothetical protein